jgi:phage gpG-like protein
MASGSSGANALISRIQTRFKSLDPSDRQYKQALVRVGSLLEAQIKINIRQKGIVDTGRLLNSIRYEIENQGKRSIVRVGSFGVPYAGTHEFGTTFTDKMRRGMFAALRRQGRRQRGKDKNVIVGGRFIARPFIGPALVQHRQKIRDILRSLIGGGK